MKSNLNSETLDRDLGKAEVDQEHHFWRSNSNIVLIYCLFSSFSANVLQNLVKNVIFHIYPSISNGEGGRWEWNSFIFPFTSATGERTRLEQLDRMILHFFICSEQIGSRKPMDSRSERFIFLHTNRYNEIECSSFFGGIRSSVKILGPILGLNKMRAIHSQLLIQYFWI